MFAVYLCRTQVARPLDFSTIKKRQKKGRYAKLGVSKLWEDVATVYGNAQLYNQVSAIYDRCW